MCKYSNLMSVISLLHCVFKTSELNKCLVKPVVCLRPTVSPVINNMPLPDIKS